MDKSLEETFNLGQLRQGLQDTAIIANTQFVRSPTPEAYLICISSAGPGRGKRFPVETQELMIGRDRVCALIVPDDSVSRQHARIDYLPCGGYQVTDLGSSNGTFINNKRVRTEMIHDGSYLRVGNCIFRFLAGGNIETAYHQELQRLKTIDPLTGLYNRRYLDQFLKRKLTLANRLNCRLAVILIDVDHFNLINLRLGCMAGDSILKDLASRLLALTQADELLARYGGEEFAIVLSETTVESASECAERIRRAVACRPFNFEGQTYMVTVSVGIGFLPAGGTLTCSDLIRQANEGLYHAKKSGRNRVAPIAQVSQTDNCTKHLISIPILQSESDTSVSSTKKGCTMNIEKDSD
jgi:two-component system cell cycle response regulator